MSEQDQRKTVWLAVHYVNDGVAREREKRLRSHDDHQKLSLADGALGEHQMLAVQGAPNWTWKE